ncbi:site-specific integrase [soil metagenome]
MALTKRDVDRLAWNPDGSNIQLHPDGEIPGFSVRVYPSGKKAFVLRYRPAGANQPKLHTIGAFGVLTLPQARDLARKALVDAKAGTDPQEERRKSRLGSTMKDLAAVYMERHAKPHKKSWKEDEWRLDKYVLPAFGSRKIEDVSRTDVARFHQKLGTRSKAEANRCLALLSIMFNLAADWGLRDETIPNPAGRIKKYHIPSRDRWVTPTEMPRLLQSVAEEPNVYVRAAVWLYLLTGLRKNELLGLRWKDIDFDRRELRLADTKAGRSHVVPLSAPAIAVLRDTPRMVGNPHIIASPVEPGRPLVNINKPWERIRKRAELEDVRLHDLRRTVGSWMATNGASLPLIGKVLNHSNASTTQIYARLAEDATRTALEEHGARIGPMLNAATG